MHLKNNRLKKLPLTYIVASGYAFGNFGDITYFNNSYRQNFHLLIYVKCSATVQHIEKSD